MGMISENPQDMIYYSEINGQLTVTWEGNKKVLNSTNTNYSYGGLQEVLNRGLRHIPTEKISSVLVLGMGAGSIVESLRGEFNYNGPITGVEVDPVVIDIAKWLFRSISATLFGSNGATHFSLFRSSERSLAKLIILSVNV